MNNIKISIVSDSHDNIDNLKKIVEISNKEECDYLFHLGDIVSPLTAEILSGFKGDVKAVFGNCDGDRIELMKVFNNFGGEIFIPPKKITISDKTFVLMHVPFLIDEVFVSGKLDYICYGHTHESKIKKSNNTILLNPGESSGIKNNPTFFILNLKNEKIEKFNL